jgi:UDP-N-acetylmuramoyl-tripeptide--D-alanyl-D-alanine ligase
MDVKNCGASAYIVSSRTKDFYVENNFKNVFIVEDTIKAMQCLAKFYLEKIKVKVIAVTGGCGKTTVKDLLLHLLCEKFNVKATKGNLNNHIGVPLTIFSLDGNEDYCVLEVGINYFGEMDVLADIIRPYVGIITMIGKSHLQGLMNLDGVLEEKCKLLDM